MRLWFIFSPHTREDLLDFNYGTQQRSGGVFSPPRLKATGWIFALFAVIMPDVKYDFTLCNGGRMFCHGRRNVLRQWENVLRLWDNVLPRSGKCFASVGECSATVGEMFCHGGRMFCLVTEMFCHGGRMFCHGGGMLWKYILPMVTLMDPGWICKIFEFEIFLLTRRVGARFPSRVIHGRDPRRHSYSTALRARCFPDLCPSVVGYRH